MTCLIERRLD